MKQILPYNALLALAVVFTCLMVFYNLSLRESFGATVKYNYPAVPQPVSASSAPQEAPEDDGNDEADYWEEYENYGFDEQTELTSVTFPLDINRATEEELRFIPNVGNVTAQRIVQYREVLGGYTDLEQLKEIKGIGGVTYERISAYLIIESELTGGITVDNN